MKTLLKTLGIVVIATIIGFSMTACGGGGGGGTTGGPISLTENQWEVGEILEADGSIEYSITVPSGGGLYNIWWNDSGDGNGTYTGNVIVTAWDNSGDLFSNKDNGWTTPEYKLYISSANTIRIRVELKDGNVANAGDFAIAYSLGTSTVPMPRPPIFPSSGITPLTADEWEDGDITTAGGEDWYSIAVTNGTTYRLWWNDSGQGDGTMTLDIKVSAWYGNGSFIFNDADTAWTSPRSFTASSGGTVYIRVSPYSSTGTGTYAIGYSTTSTKPGSEQFAVPDDATELTEAQWEDGSITSTDDVDWYSISSVTSGTYRLWWNEVSPNGDGSKTGNVKVSAWYGNGTPIFEDADIAWSTAQSITVTSANAGATIYIKVAASAVGTYSIAYSTLSSKPLILPATIIALTANTWENGELTSATDEKWYSIAVTGGTRYQLWLNERGTTGNGTKTADATVSAYNPNGSSYFTGQNTAWSSTQSFTPFENGIVYIQVAPYNSSVSSLGTYGIAYNTGTNPRPDAPIVVTPTPTPLVENVWTHDEIVNVGDVHWYSITVTSGTTYRFWGNQRDSGNDTKTVRYIRVSAYYSNTGASLFVDSLTNWNTSSPVSFTAESGGTVYVKVVESPGTTSNPATGGTYGIVYSTGASMPPAAIVIDHTPLTEYRWEDGEISTTYPPDWYTFSVTNGKTYRLWWNESGTGSGDGTKTVGDIRVSAYYGDNGAMIFEGENRGWDTAKSFTATKDATVYVKVTMYYSSAAGTYGIVYSTSTPRPVIAPDPATFITLTNGQWTDGEVTSANEVKWYKFTVTSGTTYYIWWNESGYFGNGTKTLDAYVDVWNYDWTTLISNGTSSWTYEVKNFAATANATVYVRVRANTAGNTGTFGIAYSGTGSTRPDAPIIVSATALQERTWANGNISTADTIEWYSFTVTSGTKYYIWLNMRSPNGDTTVTKTGDVTVYGYYSNGEQAIDSDSNSAWTWGRSFTANRGGTVYFRVLTTYANGVGTYGIVCSVNSTRPTVPTP